MREDPETGVYGVELVQIVEGVLCTPALGGTPQDAPEQVVRALESFQRNGFVVLVGDRQIEDLDTVVDLRMGTEITFLKLVPLVGG